MEWSYFAQSGFTIAQKQKKLELLYISVIEKKNIYIYSFLYIFSAKQQ